ncbi:MAG TPA: stage II sporulation protein M [Dyella sp.]|uniref:stage II sporulation protein M n=1 Tax=Dyella sp. TaxID=1869338 RepID=UPI002F91C0F5
MKQERFVALHGSDWDTLESWLRQVEARPQRTMRSPEAVSFPADYRRLCHHLALARARGYSREVTERLQRIVDRGHRLLYRPPAPRWRRMANFLIAGFPRLVRKEWRYMALAAALLYVPALICLLLVTFRPEFAHNVFGSTQLAEFERMYDPANRHIGRNSGTDLGMFGYYIMNNVGIAFRTFASGLVVGIGAVYVLAMNGVIFGALAGHLDNIGYGAPFWRFVVAHASFELTAIVIAGGAGLRLGLTLLAPGRQRRGPAMVEAGWIGAQLALGAFAMLVAAAFIEAFWSSVASFPDWLKYGSAMALWVLVGWWLLRGGAGESRGT